MAATYRVSPFALIYHQGLYILVAIPAKDTRIRFYRIDRMENVVISHADRLHEEVFNEIDIDICRPRDSKYSGDISKQVRWSSYKEERYSVPMKHLINLHLTLIRNRNII